MYSGFDKGAGDVIGDVTTEQLAMDISEMQDSTAVEESLICMDESGNELALNARLDSHSGGITWCQLFTKEDVLRRTVAMSQMSSMLRDSDRNSVYETAIERLISNFSNKCNKSPNVLDIGAGTGLLSLFSVRHGAKFVYAVEMFEAMADIARNVVQQNGYEDSIIVVNAKSSDIECLPDAPDLIVSELLDSALLGEGCIPAHRDAIERLLSEVSDETCPISQRVLPHSATVFATLVQYPSIRQLHDISCVESNFSSIGLTVTREEGMECHPKVPPLPVHWDEVAAQATGQCLSAPLPVLDVNFTQVNVGEFRVVEIPANQSGCIHGVLIWWHLYLLAPELDPERAVYYSSAPGVQNWQDHWHQVVCPLRQPIEVQPGDIVQVRVGHTDTRLHVEVVGVDAVDRNTNKRVRREASNNSANLDDKSTNNGECCCGWHMLCSPHRLQMMADAPALAAWNGALDVLLTDIDGTKLCKNGAILDLSDGSMLAIACGKKLLQWTELGLRVVSKESKLLSRLLFNHVMAANGVDDIVSTWDGVSFVDLFDALRADGEEGPENCQLEEEEATVALRHSVTAVISECYYYQMHSLPAWEALSFYFQVRSLRDKQLLSEQCHILPRRAFLKAALFELPDLKRCHGLVGSVCGFNHAALDDMQSNWSDHVYPYKLAQYRKSALSRPVTLGVLDYSKADDEATAGLLSGVSLPFSILADNLASTSAGANGPSRSCDALVLWVDYDLGVGEGPTQVHSVWDGKNFSEHVTVNIKFLKNPFAVTSDISVKGSIQFDESLADFIVDVDP